MDLPVVVSKQSLPNQTRVADHPKVKYTFTGMLRAVGGYFSGSENISNDKAARNTKASAQLLTAVGKESKHPVQSNRDIKSDALPLVVIVSNGMQSNSQAKSMRIAQPEQAPVKSVRLQEINEIFDPRQTNIERIANALIKADIINPEDAYQAASTLNFSNMNLTGVDLSGTKLRYAKLTGATLSDTTLDNADMTGAILAGLDFTKNVKLNKVNLVDADLRNANLSGLDMSSCSMGRADLFGAITENTQFPDKSGANFDKELQHRIETGISKLKTERKFVRTAEVPKDVDSASADHNAKNAAEKWLEQI